MPFAVTKPNGGRVVDGKLYASRDEAGDIFWQSDKRKATPLSEVEAEAVAADINRYASTEVVVEGLAPATETERAAT